MKFKDLTKQEKAIIKKVIERPNISQRQLANLFNMTTRRLREVVHELRLKGSINLGKKSYMLIADNEGYNFEPLYSVRFNRWIDRLNSTITSYTQILISI